MTDTQPSNNESRVPFDDLLSLVEENLFKSQIDMHSFIVTFLNRWTKDLHTDDEDNQEDEDEDEDEDDDHDDDEIFPRRHNRGLGCIRSVSFSNFRGVREFESTLGPGMNNFEHSRGVDKRSVLLAILIGLGCKAKDLGGNYSLRTCISNYAPTSSISVELDNTGSNAYWNQLYGNSIKVTTTLDKIGRSTYEVCSEDGEVISKEKSEIDDILSKKHISILSPFTVVTQEKAKELHKHLSGKRAFDWFITGALQACQELNLEGHGSQISTYWSVESILDSEFNRAKADVYSAEKALKAFKDEPLLSQEIERLTAKIEWAEIDNLEQSNNVANIENDQRESTMNSLLERREMLLRQRSDKSNNLQDAQERLEAANDEMNTARKGYINSEHHISVANSSLEHIEEEILEAKACIGATNVAITDLVARLDVSTMPEAEMTQVQTRKRTLSDLEHDQETIENQTTGKFVGIEKIYVQDVEYYKALLCQKSEYISDRTAVSAALKTEIVELTSDLDKRKIVHKIASQAKTDASLHTQAIKTILKEIEGELSTLRERLAAMQKEHEESGVHRARIVRRLEFLRSIASQKCERSEVLLGPSIKRNWCIRVNGVSKSSVKCWAY